jgi:cell division protein FtsQ
VTASSRSAKRRRRPSPVRRLQPFWLLWIVALGIGVAAATFLTSWSALYPHTVDVVGNRVVSRDEILARASIDYQKNMWLQNASAMGSRIDAIPYIATASVHRRLPDTLVIYVTERVPYAFLDAGGSRAIVDHELRVLQDGVPAALSTGLPSFRIRAAQPLAPGTFVTDASAQTLRANADALLSAHLDPATLELDRFGDVTVRLRNGIYVLLGDQEKMDEKVRLIEPILTQVDRGKRPVVAIDLRAVNTPVVVYGK